jgi:PKD repeat protein
MKNWLITTLIILFFAPLLQAQKISNAEYFFDSDPGFGNATNVTFTKTDSINLTQSITVPGTLPGGLHNLYVRVQNDLGTWSVPEVYHLFVQPANQSLTAMEYFFDTDPGFGNGTKTVFTPAESINLTQTIDFPATLAGGLHSLFVRTQNEKVTWSIPEVYHIFVQPGSHKLVSMEYFFDTDPGFGKGVKTIFTPADNIIQAQNIIFPDTLAGGLHSLYIRTQNEQGTWSIPEVYHINVQPGSQSLALMEYFFDTDPGFGKGIPLPVSPNGDSINSIQNIPVPNLNIGEHTLYTRTKNESQVWSFAEPHRIQICSVYGAVSGFSYYINGNEVFFTDASENSLSRLWLFGDNTTETTFNPRHVFAAGNNYTVKLITTNICGNDTLAQTIGISGIKSVYPLVAASTGIYTGYVQGLGFVPGSTVTWSKDGAADISPDTTIYIDQNTLKVIFNIHSRPVGKYNVTVQSPGVDDMILKEAILIEPPVAPDIWVRLDGRKEVIVNRWAAYTVVYGNKGNQAAVQVPIVIKLPGNIQAKIINKMNHTYELPDIKPYLPEGRFYTAYDSITNDSIKIGYFIVPFIEGGGTGRLRLEVKTTSMASFYIKTTAEKPWADESTFNNGKGMNEITSFCDPPPCAKCLLDLLGFSPAACVPATYNFFCKLPRELLGAGGPKDDLSADIVDFAGNWGGMVLSCAGGYTVGIVRKIASAVDKGTNAFSAAENCLNCRPIPPKSDTIRVRISFDPNVKTGPSGYGTQNYTRWQDPFTYSIHFENLSSATAPASEVVITDYLDSSKVDLSTLRFTGFGFADTNVNYAFPESLVVHDIDLRPAKNSIVRVSSLIDSANKLSFHFTTYDPATMKLTNSIDDGFLNPNINGTEGLGYVSYQVNTKPNLPTGTIINNTAKIVFDNNAPILTNIWTNGIDKEKPASKVMEEVVKINDSTFKISWEGTDTHAGVFFYRIMVSENDGPYIEWIATDTSTGNFVAKESVTYSFYSIAEDFVGNIENAPASADLVLVNTVGVKQPDNTKGITLYPNPTTGFVTVNGILSGDELRISTPDGKSISKKIAGSETEKFDLSKQAPGIYFLTIVSKSGQMHTMKLIKQ